MHDFFASVLECRGAVPGSSMARRVPPLLPGFRRYKLVGGRSARATPLTMFLREVKLACMQP